MECQETKFSKDIETVLMLTVPERKRSSRATDPIRHRKQLFAIQRKSGQPSHLRFKKKTSCEEIGLVVSDHQHQMDTLPNAVGDHSMESLDIPDEKIPKEQPSIARSVSMEGERVHTVTPKSPVVQQTLGIPGAPMAHRGSVMSTGTSISVSTTSLLSPSMTSGSCVPSRAESSISFIVRERLHSLALDINRRTSQVKEHIQRPPTPDSDMDHSSAIDDNDKSIADKHSLNSFIADFAPSPISHNSALDISQLADVSTWKKMLYKSNRCRNIVIPHSLDPQSKKYLVWLAFLSVCFLYNAFAIPLRAAYPYQTPASLPTWFFFDYFCDVAYIFDMVLMKPRLRFMKDGVPVRTKKDLMKRYLCSKQFKLDLLAILPLDIFYLVIGPNSLLRLPRLLKANCYWDLFHLLDSLVKNAYVLRICKWLGYLIYVIHVNSCVYYLLSAWEGLNSTSWTYNGKGNAYLRCFHFVTKVAIISNVKDPTNMIEILYMLVTWMMAMFIVAMLLGQIRDIVATASKNREEFRKIMDAALQYCKVLKVPQDVQNKVRQWFIYTWQEQKTLDENELLDKLPTKLKTDLAISVHYQTLSKVQLFQECEKAFLRDLVLKLKPVLFLPGDFVCKKGEVGKEMYIVSKGMLEVTGGPNGTIVFATLKEGSVFGEVSLLAVGGGNRRTADVRSKGFSNLFVLSKDDLNEAIRDYPDAQKILKRKARMLLKKHEKNNESKKLDMEAVAAVSSRVRTPKLFETVAQVVNPESKSGQLLHAILERDQQEEEEEGGHDSDLDSDTSSILDDVLTGMSVRDILQGRLNLNPDYNDIEIVNDDEKEQ